MTYYGKKSMSSLLKLFLEILFLGGLFLWILTFVKYILITPQPKFNLLISYIIFIIGGISAFTILYYLREIVKTLINRDPFVQSNVKSLYRISVCCFIITGTYIVNFFINKQYIDFNIIEFDLSGIHTDFELLIFLFAGLFLLILAKVFQQAVIAKEENDLTI